MNPLSDLPSLKALDLNAVRNLLADQFRAKRNFDWKRLYAAAYAAVRIQQGAADASLDAFLQTESDADITHFLANSLHGEWDAVVRSQRALDADHFAAFLLYDRRTPPMYSTDGYASSLLQLVTALLQVQPGQHAAEFCTTQGAFLLECAEMTEAATLYGNETDSESRAIAKMRAVCMQLAGAVMPYIADEDPLRIPADKHRFDRIFSGTIFASSADTTAVSSQMQQPSALHEEWAYLDAVLRCLAEDGRAVVLVRNSCTFLQREQELRRHFVENGVIEAVIALPPRLQSRTTVPVTLFVLSRGNASTCFVDAGDCFAATRHVNTLTDAHIAEILAAVQGESERSIVLTQEEIAAQDYLLAPRRLIDAHRLPKPAHGVPLERVCRRMTRGTQLRAAEMDALISKEETAYRYLMLADLQDGSIREGLTCLTDIAQRLRKYCIQGTALVIAKNGSPLKSAVAEVPEGELLLVGGNLYVVELDAEKMDPYFLKAWLDSPQGKAALEQLSVGSVIPTLPIEMLRSLTVPLPAMDVQKRIAERYRTTLQKLRKTQKKLDALRQELETIYDSL